MSKQIINYLNTYFLLLLTSTSFADAETIYTWSVVPQFTGTAVHRDWTPFLDKLQTNTGYRFKLKVYDTIPEFEIGFLKGEPDFAYMNPYHAVMAKEAQGYEPLIRNGKRMLTGILVTRKDSPIDNVKNLEGKKIAFPSPNAFAAALYMRALLRNKEGISFIPVYAGTHSNAYRQTLIGRTLASGAVERTLLKERKEVQQSLKTIYSTPSFPSHPLTIHPRIPVNVKRTIQAAILKLNDTEDGRNILEPILLSNPVKANYSEDYQPIKALKLDKYVVRH